MKTYAKNPKQVLMALYSQGITQKEAARRCKVEYSIFVKRFTKLNFSGRMRGEINRNKIRKGLEKMNIIIDYGEVKDGK